MGGDEGVGYKEELLRNIWTPEIFGPSERKFQIFRGRSLSLDKLCRHNLSIIGT